MRKWMKIMAAGLLAGTVLVTAGCNEEEKYNTAKNEVVQILEQNRKTVTKYKPNSDYKSTSEGRIAKYEDHIKALEETLNKRKDFKQKADSKLAEMKELAKKETKLNNDYIKFKQETDYQLKRIIDSDESDIEHYQKMIAEEKKPGGEPVMGGGFGYFVKQQQQKGK